MATTSLFVEVLVIGALTELWLVTFLMALVPWAQVRAFLALATSFKDFVIPLGFLLLAVTYSVGWIANFATERLFKRLFEQQLRDSQFEGKPEAYEEARLLALSRASPDLVHDVQLDRHILRISRANVVIFTLFATTLWLHWHRVAGVVLCAVSILCAAFAAASHWQWRTRYCSHYKRIARAAKIFSIDQSATA